MKKYRIESKVLGSSDIRMIELPDNFIPIRKEGGFSFSDTYYACDQNEYIKDTNDERLMEIYDIVREKDDIYRIHNYNDPSGPKKQNILRGKLKPSGGFF
jgi:hypothetical protein